MQCNAIRNFVGSRAAVYVHIPERHAVHVLGAARATYYLNNVDSEMMVVRAR